tara:strand:+ start:74 stop:502 length:429 start_codon:yes stop_codon:yes gene_type:complete
MKRTVPAIKRTYEKIALDRNKNNLNNCKVCGEKLKNVHHQRITAKMCNDCRGYGVGGNSEIRQIYVELAKRKLEPAENEMFFEDDPEAVKEIDDARYRSKRSETTYGVSELASIMTDRNHHFYKRGSAREGVRYTYKKEKKE